MQPRANRHRMGAAGSAAAPSAFPRIEGEFDFLLVSLLSLYLEILLIRWIGTEIRIFAYFANLVLVTCFFGLGVGYATPRVRMSLAHGMWLVAFLCLAVHPVLAPLGFRQISEAVATRDVRPFHVNVGIPAKSVRVKPSAPPDNDPRSQVTGTE